VTSKRERSRETAAIFLMSCKLLVMGVARALFRASGASFDATERKKMLLHEALTLWRGEWIVTVLR
jgi:hypothetical protein